MVTHPPPGVLLDYVQHMVVVLDADGAFTYANEAVKRLVGREPASLLGEAAFEYIHPEDVDRVRDQFEAVVATEAFTSDTLEYRFRASDDSWIWLESRLSTLPDDRMGYVMSSTDVSDRVAAEQAREETLSRLEAITATAGDVLWLFSGDWSELLFVNPAYAEIYGQPVEQLEADPSAFVDTIHPDDVPAVEEAMDCLAAGTPVDMEYRVNLDRNYSVSVWVQAEPIIEDGEVVRIAGFSRDVTERRRRERQLYVMDNLLRHNLRNDMEVILGNADLIEDRAPEVADRTAVIRQTGRELLASAEKERQILDLLTTGVSWTRIDLAGAVRDAVETVEARFPTATITVSAPDTAVVHAVEEIHVAVVELLDNATVHADRDQPTVDVTIRPDGDEIALIVEDDGPRMPEMEATVLTGRHDMNSIYHSSGLGVWLVYWIVELSDGHVTVEAADAGNRVVVSLPHPAE